MTKPLVYNSSCFALTMPSAFTRSLWRWFAWLRQAGLLVWAVALGFNATTMSRSMANDEALLRGANLGLVESQDSVSGDSPNAQFTRTIARYETTLATLAAVHMNLVRLWLPLIPPDAGAARLDQQHRLLSAFLTKSKAHGVKVIVVLHPFPGPGLSARAIQGSVEQQADFVEVLHRTAGWIANEPSLLAFEPMNEPPDFCDVPSQSPWLNIQDHIYKDLRKAHPNMGLVVSGPCWSSVHSLSSFNPSIYQRDKNVFYTAHYYDPVLFTHQGAGLKGGVYDYLGDMPFPFDRERAEAAVTKAIAAVKRDGKLGTADRNRLLSELREMPTYYKSVAQYSRIDDDFRQVEDWRARHGIASSRVILGEFGVHRANPSNLTEAPGMDAGNWLRAVRKAAESRGFSWAVWDFDGGFSILCDREHRTICPSYMQALFAKDGDTRRTK